MIIVGHQKEKNAVYIGRSSPLGNPYKIGYHGDRNQVCDRYEQWLRHQIAECNAPVLQELCRLVNLYRKHGRLLLGCTCNTSQSKQPKRCHAHVIKEILEEEMKVSHY